MSERNPYAKFLDGRPLEVILSTSASALTQAIKSLGPERASEPIAPGKWSPAQIACHLADCEVAFGFRLRQTLAEDNHTVQPFDQDKWAQNYAGMTVAQALVTFAALRNWNLQLIRTALPGNADRKATHPERGEQTFGGMVELMAGHDLNHLSQLQKAVSQLSKEE
ncbi:MAG TPA: DinB family protein [Terracidiphilus sp.]|nr:DinB family protein [Terracidiphilus sp.]